MRCSLTYPYLMSARRVSISQKLPGPVGQISRLGVDLNSDSFPGPGKVQPESVQPSPIDLKASGMGAVDWMHHVGDDFRRIPRACPQHLALLPGAPAGAEALKRLRNDRLGDTVHGHDTPPFTWLGRSRSVVSFVIPASFT